MQITTKLVIAALAAATLFVSSEQADAQIFGRAIGSNMTGGPAAPYWVSHSTWGDYWARNQANSQPWHGDYYYLKTGQPTALIVPPTITMQQNYSWGVSQNTMTPVYHHLTRSTSERFLWNVQSYSILAKPHQSVWRVSSARPLVISSTQISNENGSSI